MKLSLSFGSYGAARLSIEFFHLLLGQMKFSLEAWLFWRRQMKISLEVWPFWHRWMMRSGKFWLSGLLVCSLRLSFGSCRMAG